MKTISLRLPDKLLKEIDILVELGLYANRTEVLREAARNLLRSQIGSFPGKPKKVSKTRYGKNYRKNSKPRCIPIHE